MYAIPIFMLLIGLLLLCISIYLLFNDYKYVLEKKENYYYLAPNIIGVLLALFILIYATIYFFIV
ncbi:hypothetical protein IGM03_002514 [Enterococcus sp. DIV0436]|nr:hypothetical protein A5847_002669 [Enterococcus faecium]